MLSAGAVQPGLMKIIGAFRLAAGRSVQIDFATAPAITKRIAAGAPIDVVIAPTDLLDALKRSGQVSTQSVPLGRIGVGVMVRAGAPHPSIANIGEFQQSLHIAERIVYNQASTGIYLDSLFQRLGMAATMAAKTLRYADFSAVRDHVSTGQGNEIGFGATTVIIENADKGIAFVGPLPTEIQNYTAYAAALTTNAGDGAAAFTDYLASPAAQSILRAVGID